MVRRQVVNRKLEGRIYLARSEGSQLTAPSPILAVGQSVTVYYAAIC